MILIVSAVFPPEPVVSASISLDLAMELSKINEVVVLTPPPTRPYGMSFNVKVGKTDYPFKQVVLNSYVCPKSKVFGRARESWSFGRLTKRYIEENSTSIDVIYANTWPLFSQKLLVETAKKFNIPVVLHVQDIYPEILTERLKWANALINKLILPIDREALNLSTKIVTISNKMKEYLCKTRSLDEKKVDVIRNWQNDEQFVSIAEDVNDISENRKITFMYLGSISPTAGVDNLIHAFGKSTLKNAELIIAGSGSDKAKCIDIAKLYNDKSIQFCEVLRSDVARKQAIADVLLLPLKKGAGKNALPSKLTAYMFSGKPILASVEFDSEVAQIIRDSQCGFLVEAENEQALIGCLNDISKIDRSKLIWMGKNGFDFAQENMSKKQNLSKLVKVVNSVNKE